jgi:hypothetical protein
MKNVTQWFLVAVFAAGTLPLAQADQIFETNPGATNPLTGDLVSGMADFSLSGTTLTLTLTNTLAGIQSAGQLLTDVFFTLSAPGTPTLTGQTADLITLAPLGGPKGASISSNLGVQTINWGFGGATVSGLSGFELCVICQGGITSSATPTEGILGPVSTDGNYDNANKSLTNGSHSPFINDFATFTLSNVPAGATVTNVIFSFGTTPGGNVSAPEPSSITILGVALLALAGLRRKQA